MTIIANPIYDAVFKFLMEDNKVAKILLSALLKKEIVELEMRRQEYTSMQQSRISLFRIDFSAKVRDADGSENLILIELQKNLAGHGNPPFPPVSGLAIPEQREYTEGMADVLRPAYHLDLYPGACSG